MSEIAQILIGGILIVVVYIIVVVRLNERYRDQGTIDLYKNVGADKIDEDWEKWNSQ